MLAEDDHATIRIDDQWLEVEQSSLAGTPEIQLASQLGDVLVTPGAVNQSVKLSFQWTERNAAFNNEVGVFVVDSQGRVNDIGIGDPGYTEAALRSSSRQVVFSAGNQAGNWRDLSFRGGEQLAFYLVQNSSAESWLSSDASNKPAVFFSIDGTNFDGFDHVRSEDLGKGNWRLRWEDVTGGGDRDFNDVVFNVSQPGIQIPGRLGQQAPATVEWASKDAWYGNEMGYYWVDDAEGRVGNLLPGADGYAQAALTSGNSQVVFPGSQIWGSQKYELPATKYLGWYLISNGTTTDFLGANSESSRPAAFFSYSAANSDGLSHLHQKNSREWGWEDLWGGGDRDFDDLVFRFDLGLPPDEPPTALTLNPQAIAENVPANALIGTLASQDPDAGDSHTYSLVAGTGDSDNTAFSIVGSELRINSSPDFETKSNYGIRVKTADKSGLSFEQNFIINVTDVNELPTALTLSQDAINENVPANSLIGTFTSQDPDAGDSHTYGLVAGTGDSDNGAFSIVGGELRINSSPDFENKSTYGIRVRTADKGGLSFEQTFTVNVTDVIEIPPSISAVLANDTGISSSDRLTTDPTIQGQTTQTTSLLGNLNDNGFVDISSAISPDGSFTISLEQYEALSKGSFPDGSYDLKLKALNKTGQESDVTVSFVLDRTPPPISLGLAIESDRGVVGDGITTDRLVNLVGQTDPGLRVALLENKQTFIADDQGKFTFTDAVMPVAGKAPFTAIAVDAAGNQGQALNFLTREGINGAPKITSTPELVFDSTKQKTYNYQVLATDPDNDSLFYSLLNAPQEATVDKNGLITFAPTGVLLPSYDFKVEVSDGRGGTDAQTFKVGLPGITDPFGTIRGNIWDDLNGNGSRDIVNFDNFSTNASALKLNGSAVIVAADINSGGSGNIVRLTKAQGGQAGNALLQNPFDIVDSNGKALSFSTNFTFSISNPGGLGDGDGAGADGLAFIISPTINVGSVGGGIGYQGLNNSVAIELDTFNNGSVDRNNGNHIGISINGNVAAVEQTSITSRFNDGKVWNVWVDYNGDTQLLEARVSQDSVRPAQATVSTKIDIQKTLGQKNIFVGFTAATGAGVENHDILSWRFQTNEPGQAGVSVYLDTNNNGVLDNGEPVQVTSADDLKTPNIDEAGQYEFKNLLPGKYTVRELIPASFKQTFPVKSATISGNVYADVVLDYVSGGNAPSPLVEPYGSTGGVKGASPFNGNGRYRVEPVNPDVILGAPPPSPIIGSNTKVDWLALPRGSYVTVGFTGKTAIDGPGDDIFIRSFDPSDSANEFADVFVSSNGVDFKLLGTVNERGLVSLDLAKIGFTDPVTAVRVQGKDNLGSSPGFDLIGVEILPGSVATPDFYTVDLKAGQVVENNNFGNTKIPIATNAPPVITSTSPTNILLSSKYTYQVTAVDPNLDPLTYSLKNNLTGLTIDKNGLITWQPTAIGTYPIEIQVDDGKGGIATQKLSLVVSETFLDKEPPKVNVGFNSSVLNLGDILNLQVQATDNVDLKALNLSFNGNPLALSPSTVANGAVNTASITPAKVGLYDVVATATDIAGNVGTKTLQFRVIDPTDQQGPTVKFDANQFDPLKPITEVTNVIGTINDPQLEFYRVDIAPVSLIDPRNPGADNPNFVTIAKGTGNVDGVLAQIDPRQYRNDSYFVRIIAQDFSGNINVQGIVLGISSQTKPGEFRLEYNDLTVPLTGIPIEVKRVYNSLNSQVQGDFGYGWSLALQDAQIQEAARDGRDLSGDNFEFTRNAFTVGTRVTLTAPDGQRKGFTFNPVAVRGTFFGTIYKPTFTADAGIYDTLEVDDASITVRGDGSVTTLLFPLSYNPSQYRLKTKDGTVYSYDQFKGLQNVTDRNGNKLTYTNEGITSSTGQSIAFKRDAQGRITEITDPDGKAIKYSYDAKGDLTGVSDRTSYTTQLKYENPRPHYVTEVIDPLGRSATRTEYDAQGRITRLTDAAGNALDLTYAAGASSQTIKDPLGNTITRIFDARGNVVQEVDALGGITKRTYDANDNVLSKIDPEGKTMSFTYDRRGNKLSETDGEGNTKSFTYNQNSKVLTETDALGNVTTYTYDANDNLTIRKDAIGNVTTYKYGANGLLTEVIDANKQKSTFSYDGSGNLLVLTDPTGAKTKFTYDQNGRVVTSTDALGAITNNTYDAQGRLIKKVDPEGSSCGCPSGITQTEYNAASEKIATIDALGHRTEYRYNSRGLLIETILPDATPNDLSDNPRTNREYDAVDRLTATIDELGRKTSYLYDKLGRQVEVIYPDATPSDPTDNPRTKKEYDKAGLVIAEINELGNRTELAYDKANRLISSTNALKEVTTYTYDADGRQISMTDALGRKTSYTYDGLDRLITTTYANNTKMSTAYDPLGRVVAQTDMAGNVTQYEYNLIGRLTAVVDALNQRTEYKYDLVGNRIEQKDANGNVTKFEYDSLRRRKATILPGGQRNATIHNTIGNLISTTDYNGATTSYEYDARNRVIKKSFSDGTPTESFTYTLTGEVATVTDNRGVVNYAYDDRDRLLSRTEPDGRKIQYTYDVAGNILSLKVPSGTTTYTYDTLNRIDTVIAPDLGKTDYTYDQVGNLIKTEFTNGVTENRQYDLLNRLTYLEDRNQTGITTSYTYTLDAIGNRTKVVEQGGRTVEYAYDLLYRLTQEKITDAIAGNRLTDYEFDAVGNRLERTDSIDGKTTYTYDVNDRLLQEALGGKLTEYKYDAKGNLTAKIENGVNQATYQWNAKGELTAVEVTENGVTGRTEFEYDDTGIRVSIKLNGEETRFLIDNNQQQYAQVIEEYQLDGAVKTAYVHGWDLISQTNASGTNYYQVDGLGSTRQLISNDGIIRVEYDYDAYGNLTNKVGGVSNDYLFAGEQFDESVDEYYLRARYYNPATGRFGSIDPFEGYAKQPISLHDYLYGNANPSIYTDPSGKVSAIEYAFLVGAVSGAILAPTFDVICKIVLGEGDDITITRALKKSVVGASLGAAIGGFIAYASLNIGVYALFLESSFLSNLVLKQALKEFAKSQTFFKVPSLGLVFLGGKILAANDCDLLQFVAAGF